MIKSLLKVFAFFLFIIAVVSTPLTAHTETEIGTTSLDYLSALVSSLSKIVSSLASSVASLVNPSSQLAQVAPTDGLVAHWTFDEGSGTTAEDSAGSNTGTLTNGPAWVEGKVGSGALQFGGVDNIVKVSNLPAIEGINSFSVSAWVYPTGLTAVNYMILDYSGYGNDMFELVFEGDQDITFRVITEGGNTVGVKANGISLANQNKWYHIVGVYDGANVRVYVDKVLGTKAQGGLTGKTLDVATNFSIPTDGVSSGVIASKFIGKIDDVRIYSRALISTEIADLYALGGSSGPSSDTAAPSVPAGLQSTAVSSSQINLSWNASTDDTAVAGYHVYRNGAEITTTGNTSYSNTGLSPATTYIYTVSAYDAAGNSSVQSSQAQAITQAVTVTATGISCGSDCSETLNSGTAITLTITPITGSTFQGWSGGGCSGTGACSITLNSNTTVTATFNTQAVIPPAGVQIISSEALVELPTSALWSSQSNFQPGDGESVDINPPIFSWLYSPDPKNMALDRGHEPYLFIFQVSNSSNFTSPVVSILTRSASYNTLDHLPSGTYYWRVGYVRDSQYESGVPNAMPKEKVSTAEPSIINAFIPQSTWSATRTFTIPQNAPVWDRGMLASESYLSSKAVHPRIIFNQGNLAGFRNFMFTQKATIWNQYRGYADSAIASAWWRDKDVAHTTGAGRLDDLMYVAFAWQMTGDVKYLDNGDTQQLLVLAADEYINSGAAFADMAIGIYGIEYLAMAYDWLYDTLSPEQRSSIVRDIGIHSKWVVMQAAYYSKKSGSDDFKSGVYSDLRQTSAGSIFKYGESHQDDNLVRSLVGALSVYSEDSWSRMLLDFYFNSRLAEPFFDGREGTLNGGMYASYVEQLIVERFIWPVLVFPEAQFNKLPYLFDMADWAMRTRPVGSEGQFIPWGDSHYTTDLIGQTWAGLLARFTNNNELLKQHNLAQSINPGNLFGRLQMPGLGIEYSFALPANESSAYPLAKAFREAGWITALTQPVNSQDVFTDGLGMVMPCRPISGGRSHSASVDLSFDLWAYGQSITENGAADWGYNKQAMAHNTLMVNGLGVGYGGAGRQSQ